MIGEPYSIEADIRGKPTDEQQHMRQRKASRRREASEARIRGKARNAVAQIGTARRDPVLAESPERSDVVLRAGRAEISNSLAENALRCVSLGRKNFLFVGSDSGCERAAAMYGLLGTCKLNGVNPRAYLEYVLTYIADRVATRVDELLPWSMADKLMPATPPKATI